MKIILDDVSIKADLYPFTLTRSVINIRVGILTIREKWKMLIGDSFLLLSESEVNTTFNNEGIKIPANLIPSRKWIDRLEKDKAIIQGASVSTLEHPWQIFENNDQALREDFELLTKGKTSQPVSSTNKTINPANIFLEEGAVVEHSILNGSTGPIYIGKNAEIMEGCMIRGPFALGEKSKLKMGTKIYGATTIGPGCLAGGEIKNSVLFGNSNKAHDGYLGDSIIGEWCNLGAGTSNSNIKNTAAIVKAWSRDQDDFIPAGLKCGLMMGDYSRCAINTSFNTGTVAGICCNIFCEGFPPKYIPDFTWGNERYNLEKAFRDIDNWKKLKGGSISKKEKEILSVIYSSKK